MAAVRENRVKTPAQARRAAAALKAQQEEQAAAAKAKASVGPRAWFLIAETLPAAAAVAEHEWGWTKGKLKSAWTDGAGNSVKWLADYDALVKEAGKTDEPIAVYCGHRWYAVIPSHLFHKLVTEGFVLKQPDPAPTTGA